MQVTVKGIHMDVGEALTGHVEKAVNSLSEKYFADNAIDGTVSFTKERNHRFTAHLSLRMRTGEVLEASSQSEDVHIAFDEAQNKLNTRLRRYKDRLRDHHRKEDMRQLHMGAYKTFNAAEEAESGDEPAVVAEMEMSIPTLAVADAVMQLELRDLSALMFRNPAHGGYNMVFRRPDGNIGWVDPEGLSKSQGGQRATA